jgi:hypothetical protein
LSPKQLKVISALLLDKWNWKNLFLIGFYFSS